MEITAEIREHVDLIRNTNEIRNWKVCPLKVIRELFYDTQPDVVKQTKLSISDMENFSIVRRPSHFFPRKFANFSHITVSYACDRESRADLLFRSRAHQAR